MARRMFRATVLVRYDSNLDPEVFVHQALVYGPHDHDEDCTVLDVTLEEGEVMFTPLPQEN